MRSVDSSKLQSGYERGAAIVAVLAIMALIAIVVIALLGSSSIAYRSEVEISRARQANQLADDAVNLVIAQIRSATEVKNSGWASQPGVIRVWGEDGRFSGGFKLYSDETMIESDERALSSTDFDDLKGTEWFDKPWLYTDLNEPAIRGEVLVNPIASPEAKGTYEIEGFDFNHDKSKMVISRKNDLPMPVKWIYQLADLTLGTLNESKVFVAFSGSKTSTKENPIVARFAFWADDESCKLNPNVNAGGIAFGPAFAGGALDRIMDQNPPIHNEWQKYSGHPATTSLAPLFYPKKEGLWRSASNYDEILDLYELVPRVASPKSRSMFATSDWKGSEVNGIVVDRDPLHPSVDDLVYLSDREIRKFPGIEKKKSGDFVENAKFFLTVDSVSPETTFGGLPRVSIWPTSAMEGSGSAPRRTVLDEAIRKCAELVSRDSMGSKAFHFQRLNADSSTVDWSGIHRNRELFQYLDRLLEENMPGIGKSFSNKYSKHERLQLLTQIFDYIRCTNLHDDALLASNSPLARFPSDGNSSNHVTFTNGRVQPGEDYFNELRTFRGTPEVHKGHGQVTPISITHSEGLVTKGQGRFYTMQEIAVQVIACADGGDGTGGGGWRPANPGVEGSREQPGGRIYSNFPPLPLSVDRKMPSTWPSWMTELKRSNPELIDVAFDPKKWNWQLAWLDPAYANAMPGRKFDRSLLGNAEITRLGNGERLVQAGLIWSMVCPSLGRAGINPDLILDVEIEGMEIGTPARKTFEFGWTSKPTFSLEDSDSTAWFSNRTMISRNDHSLGGFKMPSFFQSAGVTLPGLVKLWGEDEALNWYSREQVYVDGRVSPLDRHFPNTDPFQRYHYLTVPFRATDSVDMNEGAVGIRIYSPGSVAENEYSASQASEPQLVQELQIPFPAFSQDPPELAFGTPEGVSTGWPEGRLNPMVLWSLGWDGANPEISSVGRMAVNPAHKRSAILEGDVVQSVVVQDLDARMLATKSQVGADSGLFIPHHQYGLAAMAHSFYSNPVGRIAGATFEYDHESGRPFGVSTDEQSVVAPVLHHSQRYGDFDSGAYLSNPGSWINKPDEGNGHYITNRDRDLYIDVSLLNREWGGWSNLEKRFWGFPSVGYFRSLPSLYTPNRIINSPGMFGSLPVGVTRNESWRTLLFRPQVSGNGIPPHPGAGSRKSPADHRLLDLFWMPIVEPWLISGSFSTRGKVNLNYQLLPFKHIERNTAMRGVLESETTSCVPNKWATSYKNGHGRGRGYHWRDNPSGGDLAMISLRSSIAPDATLKQFSEKFESEDAPTVFRTASEICDVHLVPEDLFSNASKQSELGTYTPTVEEMKNGRYRADHQLVGDEARERPYSNIYSRVTTRSNVFRVHVRAQTLNQVVRNEGEDFSKWDEEKDVILSEYRGSSTIERFLDGHENEIPDFALESESDSLDPYYSFRIIRSGKFSR